MEQETRQIAGFFFAPAQGRGYMAGSRSARIGGPLHGSVDKLTELCHYTSTRPGGCPMLKGKDGEQKFYYNISLEELVPHDHFLRHVDRLIDFDFIRSRVKHLYSHTGKPAIDPVVLFKMLLIGYLYDVKSERQLEKEIQVNLAYRWFIKYDIDERIPDHSTISQTRRRKFLGSNLFQEIFDEIVKLCSAKGLITGETIMTDSTYIRADASFDSLREVLITPREFIQRLDENSDEAKDPDTGNKSGQGGNSQNKRYSNKTHRSKSDPDSRIMSRKGMGPGLFYKEHRSLDSDGYITDVHVTAGNIPDSDPYVTRLKRQRDVFLFPIDSVVADRGYGISHIYKDLTEMGIDAYIPQITSPKQNDRAYPQNNFVYDKVTDTFRCPAGHSMKRKLKTPRKNDGGIQYKSSKRFCNNSCPHRNNCTTGGENSVREVQRNVYQDYIDYQIEKQNSHVWRALLKKRKTMVEGSFADAKENHGMRRAKYRGLAKVREQSFMTAIVQNIKKMIKNDQTSKRVIEMAKDIILTIRILWVWNN
jgi:transposase